MKKQLVLIVLLSLGFGGSVSAQSFGDVFNPETEITWLGVDYTIAKVIGEKEAWGNRNPSDMFQAWNQLLITEKDKYNAAKALHRKTVKLALDVTMDHNARLNVVDFFADDVSPEYMLKAGNVQSIVNLYDFKGNTGIGMMLIAESYNKKLAIGTYWIVFVNMNSREVLYTQKIEGEAGGAGLRNYWGRTVLEVFIKMEKKEYKGWQRSAVSYK